MTLCQDRCPTHAEMSQEVPRGAEGHTIYTSGCAKGKFWMRIRPGGHSCGSSILKAHLNMLLQQCVLNTCYALLHLQIHQIQPLLWFSVWLPGLC